MTAKTIREPERMLPVRGEYDVVGKITGVVQRAKHASAPAVPAANPTIGGLRSSLAIIE